MTDTPESDKNSVEWDRANEAGCSLVFAQGLERERDELRQVIRDVHKAFPDLAEFQDKNGWSLKWLADKIEKAKGES
jgi:hypothetical protein